MALEIDSVKFSCMDPERIRQLSVVQISLPDVVDNLNRPIAGGLYDGKMGPIDRQMRCMTCSLSYKECPGHMGQRHLRLSHISHGPMGPSPVDLGSQVGCDNQRDHDPYTQTRLCEH